MVKLSNSVIFVKFEFMVKLMFDSGELCQHISDNILLYLVNFVHHFDHFLELCSCQDRGNSKYIVSHEQNIIDWPLLNKEL